MEFDAISLNLIFTILGFIFGQMTKFIIEPVHDLRKHIFQAKYVLDFYHPTYRFPLYRNSKEFLDKHETIDPKRKEEYEKTVNELRSAAINLFIGVDNVIFYNIFYLFKILPNKANLIVVAGDIQILSYFTEIGNEIYEDNGRFRDHIKSLDSYFSWKKWICKNVKTPIVFCLANKV